MPLLEMVTDNGSVNSVCEPSIAGSRQENNDQPYAMHT